MKAKHVATGVVFALMPWFFTGCAHQLAKKTVPAAVEDAAAEPSVRGDTLVGAPELKAVYFDFNSTAIGREARATLEGNAAWLARHAEARIQVAGFCDQRGTVEYNLALGQRRAAAVRDYYVHLGVAGGRIATISYGKERPACGQATEACWRRNRRADHFIAVPQSVHAAPVRARSE